MFEIIMLFGLLLAATSQLWPSKNQDSYRRQPQRHRTPKKEAERQVCDAKVKRFRLRQNTRENPYTSRLTA